MMEANGADQLRNQITLIIKLLRMTVSRPNPNYPPVYGDEFESKLKNRIKETDLAKLSIPIYAKTFSVEELKQIVAFQRSSVGHKLAVAQPEIISTTYQACLLMALDIVPAIDREIVAGHPEWKKLLGETPDANGDLPPSIISKRDPTLPKGMNPKSGTVMLSLVIDENGLPQNVKVVKPMGDGFDENAIEAVQKWRFKPGMKGGLAVKTAAKVEVIFRAIEKP
jgi:TonB family protein